MEIVSFTKTFLYVLARQGCSARRTQAAVRAARARWPEGRWAPGRRCLNLVMPDGSVGLTLSWRERPRKPLWVSAICAQSS